MSVDVYKVHSANILRHLSDPHTACKVCAFFYHPPFETGKVRPGEVSHS